MNKVHIKLALFAFTAFLLTTTASLRLLGEDIDYQHYLNMYNYGFHEQEATKEFTFVALRYITHLLFDGSFTVFLFIFALLGVSIKLTAIYRLSPLPFLSLAIYIMTYYPLHEYTQIRAGVAAGIMLLATKDLADHRNASYIFKIILATMFHWISLIALGLLAAFRLMPLKVIYLLPGIGIAFALIGQYNIDALPRLFTINAHLYEYYQTHAGHIERFNTFNILFLINAAWFLAIYLWTPKEILNQKNLYTALLSLYSFSIFIYLTTSPFSLPVISHRIFEFLNISLILLLPSFVNLFKVKILPTIMALLYALAMFGHLLLNVHIFPELI